MLVRVFFYLMGYAMSVSGGITTIAYLNVFPMGVNLLEFLQFITQRAECYLLPIGFLIITISIYYPIGSKNK